MPFSRLQTLAGITSPMKTRLLQLFVPEQNISDTRGEYDVRRQWEKTKTKILPFKMLLMHQVSAPGKWEWRRAVFERAWCEVVWAQSGQATSQPCHPRMPNPAAHCCISPNLLVYSEFTLGGFHYNNFSLWRNNFNRPTVEPLKVVWGRGKMLTHQCLNSNLTSYVMQACSWTPQSSLLHWKPAKNKSETLQ